MSNPVSNAEVEDVLASIRRLVSEDNRPSRAVPQPETLADEAFESEPKIKDAETPGKLVLTESQRVVPAPGDDPTDDGFAQEEEAQLDAEPYVLREEAEIDADWEQQEKSFAHDLSFAEPAAVGFVADGSDADDDTSSEESAATLSDFIAQLDDTETADLPQDNDLEVEPDAETLTSAEILHLDPAARTDLFKDEAEAADEAISDVSEPAEPEALAAPQEDWSEPEEIAALESEEDSGSNEPRDEGRILDNRAARQMKLGAKIAALEAVIGRRDDQWEPDGLAEDAYSGTASPSMEWQDSAPAQDMPDDRQTDEMTPAVEPESQASVDQPQDTTDENEFEFTSSEDSVVDAVREEIDAAVVSDDVTEEIAEEIARNTDVLDVVALRSMVSDIVREELQGPLGERITRNVRKLVRREIQRALASQDFE